MFLAAVLALSDSGDENELHYSGGRSLLGVSLRGRSQVKQLWDVGSALKRHKLHKKKVNHAEVTKLDLSTAKESSAPSGTKTSAATTTWTMPKDAPLVDAEYHVAKFGWDHAEMECHSEGRRLCSSADYCSNGKPLGGTLKNDVWAPAGDKRGEYLQLGDFMKERICQTHSGCCGGLPGWGQTGQDGAQAKCCGKPDKAIFNKFLEEMKVDHLCNFTCYVMFCLYALLSESASAS
jgi:hypothetical protein